MNSNICISNRNKTLTFLLFLKNINQETLHLSGILFCLVLEKASSSALQIFPFEFGLQYFMYNQIMPFSLCCELMTIIFKMPFKRHKKIPRLKSRYYRWFRVSFWVFFPLKLSSWYILLNQLITLASAFFKLFLRINFFEHSPFHYVCLKLKKYTL